MDGLQLDADYRLGASWKVAAGYLFNRARVVELKRILRSPITVRAHGRGHPALRAAAGPGIAVPADLVCESQMLPAALSIRTIGRQFDTIRTRASCHRGADGAGYPSSASTTTIPGLPKYTIVSITVSRAIGRSSKRKSARRAFDREYFVGTLPTTIGSPRMVNAGLRFGSRGGSTASKARDLKHEAHEERRRTFFQDFFA